MMNLTEIIKYITNKLEDDQRLKSTIVDDVYKAWNKTNSSNQYTSAVVDFNNSSYMGDYVDYSFYIYVGNVINENQKNIYRSISIAVSIIHNLLHKIDVEENDMLLVVPNTITPFVQQFEDVLAGCYCMFTIRIQTENICDE